MGVDGNINLADDKAGCEGVICNKEGRWQGGPHGQLKLQVCQISGELDCFEGAQMSMEQGVKTNQITE